jgi:photosystem II stability/assembly factor-like uncharacterized protein
MNALPDPAIQSRLSPKPFPAGRLKATLRLAALLLLPLPLLAEHSLYMSATLSQDFTIGRRVTSDSGLYVSHDRETARHLGFHHPRLDRGDYDPRDPDVLYVGALNGVLGTRDGGQSWKILTSWDMTEAKDVKVDPHRPDRVLAALPDGIAISPDQGKTWHYSDEGIRRKYTQTLAPDRVRKDHILAGTELGIFRSTDGGLLWTSVLATSATVNHIVQSPHDPDRFLAATQENGAWLSGDAGLTWKQVHPPEPVSSFHTAAFHPRRPGVLTLGGWGYGLRLSTDLGKSWSQPEGLPHDNIWSHTMDPDYPDRLYASLYRDTVYVSDDFGRTWEPFLFPGATIWGYIFVPRD